MTAARCCTFAACIAGFASLAAACTPNEPPAPGTSPWVAAPESSLSLPSASDSGVRSLPPVAGPTAASAPASAAPVTAPPDAPASTDAGPSVLGQTHDKPTASGPLFEARAALLWQAIVRDDADEAMPFFFPVGAYAIVKDVGDPAADWNHRLVSAFRRDIHALHARLGADAARATWSSLDVPQSRARWVEPGEEWNKVGYFRVFGSKLRYEVDGEAREFDVKSLISWRGEWFVVHLTAVR